MGYKNVKNATLSYYKGIVRELSTKLNNALVRIAKLEKQIRKFSQVTPFSAESYGSFSNEQTEELAPNFGITGTGGLSEAQIRLIVNDAIEQRLLIIPIHDHTADDKGGDCYANLGAKLQ